MGSQQTPSEIVQESNRDTEIPGMLENDAEALATASTPPALETPDMELLALASNRTNNSASTNTTPSPPQVVPEVQVQLQTPPLDPRQKFREEYLATIKNFKVRICEDCLRAKWERLDATNDSPGTQQRPSVSPPVEDIHADCACLRYLRLNENTHLNILKRATARSEENTRNKYAKVLRGPTNTIYPHAVDKSFMYAAQMQREEVYRQIMKDTFGFASDRHVFFLTFQRLYRKAYREGIDLWISERMKMRLQGKLYEDALRAMREAQWGFCPCGKLVDWNREHILGGTGEFGQMEIGIACLGCGAWQCLVKHLGLVKDALIREKGCSVGGMRAMEERLCCSSIPPVLDLQRAFPGGSSHGGPPSMVPGVQAIVVSAHIVPQRLNPVAPVFEANGANRVVPAFEANGANQTAPTAETNSGNFVLDETAFNEEEEMIGEILGRSACR